MASTVVMDSGVLIASVLREPLTATAVALLQRWKQEGARVAAPVLLHYELVAVLRKLVVQARMTPDEALQAL